MSKKLTSKQEQFCQLFVELQDAKAAYKMVYSEHVARMSAMLKNPLIINRLNELDPNLLVMQNITKAKVLTEYSKIAFSSIAHYHNSWVERKEFDNLSEQEKSAIKSIRCRSRMVGEREVEEVFVELHDKMSALNHITKIMGYDSPSRLELAGVNSTATNPEPIIIEVIDRRKREDGKNSD